MQLNIPSKYEPLIKARAQAAGFEDRVGEYLVRLVTQDAEDARLVSSAIDLTSLSADEVSKLIDDGYASGIAGEMDQDYFDRLRNDLRQQVPDDQA